MAETMIRVAQRLERSVWERVRDAAQREEISMAEFVRRAILRELKRRSS